MKKPQIKIVAPKECGWGVRCVLHCRLVKGIQYDALNFTLKDLSLGKVDRSKVDFTKEFPQVYVDGKYIGGFYELIEKFPV
jgi:hypothetical protein